MYLKCAHPECHADFDYGQGRFFRFQQFPPQNPLPANSHCVRHFWLCTRCCETFTIDYQKDLGVLLRQKLEAVKDRRPSYFILQDERPSREKVTRIRRARTRSGKRKGDLTAGQTNTIEILENRVLERRS
jgi:hypothetical protein